MITTKSDSPFYVGVVLPAKASLPRSVRLFRSRSAAERWVRRSLHIERDQPGFETAGEVYRASYCEDESVWGLVFEKVLDIEVTLPVADQWWGEFMAWRDGPLSPGENVSVAEWHEFMRWRSLVLPQVVGVGYGH